MKMTKELKKILIEGLKRGYLLESELIPHNQSNVIILDPSFSRTCVTCEKRVTPIYENDNQLPIDKEMKAKILQALLTNKPFPIDYGIRMKFINHYKACESCPEYLNQLTKT